MLKTEVAVIGASLGGVLAAWSAARAGRQVLLVAQYDWLGGQMTAQGVPPDEHRLIEQGGASRSYQDFRAAIRAHYRDSEGFTDRTAMTEGLNPGDGWVSRLCFEPEVAADYFERLLAPLVDSGRLQILRGQRAVAASRSGRRIASVTLLDGREIAADYFLDATDTGALIQLAGLPYRLGKEARAEFGESLAPETANPLDQQPITHVIALRRQASPGPVIEAPPSYAFWRAHRLPQYGHALFSEFLPGGTQGESKRFALFAASDDPQDPTLDLWRYRRIVAAHQWKPPREEVSLINWAQNDYGLQPLLDGPLSEEEVEAAARELSLCLLHWLQTEAPRADGGQGYPELQPAAGVLGTADGLAQQVYVRESRRIVGLDCLTQQRVQQPAVHEDSVGVAWYMMDMHPTCVSGQGLNAHVRPFELPLGCFIAADCDNLLPACKNLSVTHLVNACTRVHPAEWLIGEVAGALAAFALEQGLTPAQIRADADRLAALQAGLSAQGIPLHWDAALLAQLS
ncbi:FAD-dependent oxidoreductase [Roseateles violae]|uniref:FAD-dependent oxidoreductase n=1 Tax=Roseateles violae TaxID=3058042 RepID=A0ABT8DQP2_9BURK|nr:FAD-dependent oxidoreductase [Pelomonas sp. PFR6]MDN3920333.1 FAD-dependent oxidoreductase [Pelomonas sp. PFR6]